MRTYEITNERTGKKITVSGASIRDVQVKAANKIKNKGWTNEDIYRSEEVELKGFVVWIASKLGLK